MNVVVWKNNKSFSVTARGKWLDASVEELAKRVGDGIPLDASTGRRAEGRVRDLRGPLRIAQLVVVTCVSRSYLPVFELWIDLVPSDLEVVCVCLDDDVELKRCRVVRASAATREEIWLRRLEAVRSCLREGKPVIHSDVDAFWLRDPRDSRDFGGTAAAAVFSTDHGLGKGRKQFALCCGFYRLDPTADNLAFVERWLRATASLGDDQVALNALYDAGLGPRGGIELLPYDDFARCNSDHPIPRAPIVWHPWLPGDDDVTAKRHVWARLLEDLRRGDVRLLDAFYEARRSLVLDPPELDRLLRET